MFVSCFTDGLYMMPTGILFRFLVMYCDTSQWIIMHFVWMTYTMVHGRYKIIIETVIL